jgi:glycosyltransferase involved in cell wall biosynthesis
MQKATGDYVFFLDSDDLLLPDHLEVLHRHILLEKYPDFIATKYVFNQQGVIIPSDLSDVPGGYIDFRFFIHGNPMACNFCVKRSNPNLVPFEPDRRYAIMEDWMFLLVNLAKDKLFLVDKVTVQLREHEARSMRADALLLTERRLLATDWIMQRLLLNEKEKRQLSSGSFYFCAIHYYLDGNRAAALKYWRKSIRQGGLQQKHLLMAIKIMLGYSFVAKLGRRK